MLFTKLAKRLNHYDAYSDSNWTIVAFNVDRQKLEENMRFLRENADIHRLAASPSVTDKINSIDVEPPCE